MEYIRQGCKNRVPDPNDPDLTLVAGNAHCPSCEKKNYFEIARVPATGLQTLLQIAQESANTIKIKCWHCGGIIQRN